MEFNDTTYVFNAIIKALGSRKDVIIKLYIISMQKKHLNFLEEC